MAAKAQNFDDVDIPSKNDTPRVSDLVEMYKWPDGKYGTVRFLGALYAYGGHWVKTKKKDGTKGSFYAVCSAWDPETGKFDSTKNCEWCNHTDSDLLGERTISRSVEYYSNVIDRKAQRNKPEDAQAPSKSEVKTGFITKDSETWTPVKVARCTPSVVKLIQGLRDLNVHEDANGDAKGFPVSHPKYGMDVSVKFDSKAASPSQAYSVQRGDATPLKSTEKIYLTWDLSDLVPYPSSEEVQEAYESWLKRNGGVSSKKKVVDEDDDEDDVPKKSSKKKVVEDDDFDDEDEDDEPPKKKKPVKKVADEDDDEDDVPKKKKPTKRVVDEDDDDEDEPPKKSSKKKVVDDFDDDDEDEPPKKSSKKKVVDDFDDDDEDEPPKKKKLTKKVVEEDDDDGL